ncbi:MAG: molecular chaperone HtpG [Rickettsiales bacterium]|nr:molecular chaperone HtpG [Rickettsiales bacterium]
MTNNQEKFQFGAEVGKILQLMIHSLYTNKDIFLRELISNASDACDKLRYESLTKPELLQEDSEFNIRILPITLDRTLTISDNGIGMNKDDLVTHLGTIAKSGTQGFLESMTGDNEKDVQLIGQFGVGFYSAFMVADSVTVISRKAGEDQAYIWQSTGTGEFTVEEAADEYPRGTTIKLKLKKEADEYLDKHRLEHIIGTYSDHIPIPIILEDEAGGESATVNKASALWTKSKNEITEEQYKEFYHHVAHAADDPMLTLHNKNEGTIEYTNLLFIPSTKPFDLFHPDRKCRIKLYVKRVFINEEGIDIIPQFLRFVQGIVDSEDLPLNINRESLQHNATINRINKAVTKRILKELSKLSDKQPDEFKKFWKNFGAVFKEGLCDATNDRDAILDVCRFYSTKSGDELISLKQYIENMKEGQDKILFISADSVEAARKSPQLEGFVKNDIEVILLTDSVDDFWTNVTQEYKDKAFASVTRSNINPDSIGKEAEAEASDDSEADDEKAAEANKVDNAEHEKLINFIRETLKDRVADVKVSGRLTESPVCLSAGEYGMDIRMERFLVEQKQLPKASAKVLEINPNHQILKSVLTDIDANEERAKEVSFMLFDQACIIEGETIKDTSSFAKRLSKLMEDALKAA